MNINKLLRCGDGVCAPSSDVNTENVDVITENVTAEPNNKSDESELDEKSVAYVLKRLKQLSKTVFQNIEMTDLITEKLVFNLPPSTIDASKNAVEKGLDFMDPVLLLYPFFAKKDVGSIYVDYLRTLRDMLTTEGVILDFCVTNNDDPNEDAEEPTDPTVDDGTDYEPDGEPEEDDTQENIEE